jgi:predicted secreted protein
MPSGWRVGQSLQVKTTKLDTLPKMVASAQRVLALSGIQFGLANATVRKLDDQRIAAAYKNLNERMASIANAMGRKLSDAVLETVDLEGSGNYAHPEMARAAPMAMKAMRDTPQVEEPSFEPGETTLQMNLVGKVKFK